MTLDGKVSLCHQACMTAPTIMLHDAVNSILTDASNSRVISSFHLKFDQSGLLLSSSISQDQLYVSRCSNSLLLHDASNSTDVFLFLLFWIDGFVLTSSASNHGFHSWNPVQYNKIMGRPSINPYGSLFLITSFFWLFAWRFIFHKGEYQHAYSVGPIPCYAYLFPDDFSCASSYPLSKVYIPLQVITELPTIIGEPPCSIFRTTLRGKQPQRFLYSKDL